MPPTTIAAMKKLTTNDRFGGAGKCATHANSTAKKAIPFAALALLLYAILSSSGCIGLTSASKPASSQQSTPAAAALSIAPMSVSFGSVALGEAASQSVTITNGGGSNVTVTQASTTAAGVTVTGISFPLTIAAGNQATFNVIFSPKAPGALSGNVAVMSNVSSSPSTVSLSGTGMAATAVLTTSTSSLSFGNVVVGNSSGLSVTLTNAGNSNVTVSNVSVSGAHFSESGVSTGSGSGARTIHDVGCYVLSRGHRQLVRQRNGGEQRHKFSGDVLPLRGRHANGFPFRGADLDSERLDSGRL